MLRRLRWTAQPFESIAARCNSVARQRHLAAYALRGYRKSLRAFSSEVVPGSREENASKQEIRALLLIPLDAKWL
jgi:hypothetical protein